LADSQIYTNNFIYEQHYWDVPCTGPAVSHTLLEVMWPAVQERRHAFVVFSAYILKVHEHLQMGRQMTPFPTPIHHYLGKDRNLLYVTKCTLYSKNSL